MLKNHHLVKAAEREFESTHPFSMEKSWAMLEDMHQFASKFSRCDTPPEHTPHVRSLVKLAMAFKKMSQTKTSDA